MIILSDMLTDSLKALKVLHCFFVFVALRNQSEVLIFVVYISFFFLFTPVCNFFY